MRLYSYIKKKKKKKNKIKKKNKKKLKLQITQQQECFHHTLFRGTAGTETDRKPPTMYRIVNYYKIHQLLQPPFLQGLDFGFMKILHIFYNLMLNRPFDAMFWRISAVCLSVHRLKLTSDVYVIKRTKRHIVRKFLI